MTAIDWSLVTNVASVSGILLGVFFGLRQLRDIVKSRNTDLFVDLYNQLTSKEFQRMYNDIVYNYKWVDYEDWLRKYGPDTNPEAWANFNSVGYFFDGIGVLVHKKLIDIQLVDDLMSSAVIWLWEKTGPIIQERRLKRNRPQIWEWVEFLYYKIKENDEATSVSKPTEVQKAQSKFNIEYSSDIKSQLLKKAESWGLVD
jgi:hypothetical protein